MEKRKDGGLSVNYAGDHIAVIVPSRNEPRVQEVVDTVEALFSDVQVIVSEDKEGKGKGWAIREGLKKVHVQRSLVFFIDGDMDIHPSNMVKLLDKMMKTHADVVVGVKHIKSGRLSRRIISFLCRVFVRVVFGLKVQTQTGLKLYKWLAIRYWEEDRYAFDIEMLYKAKKDGRRIAEVPVNVSLDSRMSIRTVFSFIWAALKLRWRLFFGSR